MHPTDRKYFAPAVQLRSALQTKRLKLVEPFLIICFLSIVIFPGLTAVKYHPDEGFWLSATYVVDLLLDGDFTSPAWEENYRDLRHPLGTVYVISLGQMLGGYDTAEFKALADYVYDAELQRVRNVEDADLIWWSRLPMAILAVICGLLIFSMTRQVAGRAAAYLALVLFVANPFLLLTTRRAMSETPLLVCVLLAMFAGQQAVRSAPSAMLDAGTSRRLVLRQLLWFSLLGVFAGWAAAAKLNGATAVGGGIALALLYAIQRPAPAPARRSGLAVAAIAAVAASGMLTFIVLNPYLYPDVAGRLMTMFTDRISILELQQSQSPKAAILSLHDRLTIVPQYIFKTLAALRFPGAWLVNGLLCAAGLWYLLRSTWHWIRDGRGSPAGAALLTLGVAAAGPPLMTPLNWQRYYLLPVVLSTIYIAIGASRSLVLASALVRADKATKASEERR